MFPMTFALFGFELFVLGLLALAMFVLQHLYKALCRTDNATGETRQGVVAADVEQLRRLTFSAR